MSDLIAAITGITNPSDFPCCDVPPRTVRVLVWRVICRCDECDINDDHYGQLIDDNDDEITILEGDDKHPTIYPKKTSTGVDLYRMKEIH